MEIWACVGFIADADLSAELEALQEAVVCFEV